MAAKKYLAPLIGILLLVCNAVSCGGGSPAVPPIPTETSTDYNFVSSIETLCSEDIAVLGDTLYIADGPGGLKIVDLSNRSSPVLIGTEQTAYAFRIYIYKQHLYLCDSSEGLKIYSIESPLNPVLRWSVDTDWATSVVFHNGNMFLGDFYKGIRIYNVGNPASPELLEVIDSTIARDITFLNGFLLVSNKQTGLNIYNYDPQTASYRTYSFDTLGNYEDIVGYNNYAIISRNDCPSSLYVFNVKNFNNIRTSGVYNPARFIDGLTRCEEHLMVACGEDGLIIYDLNGLPELSDGYQIDTPGYVRRAKMNDGYLYIADMASVQVYSQVITGGDQ